VATYRITGHSQHFNHPVPGLLIVLYLESTPNPLSQKKKKAERKEQDKELRQD